MSFRDRTRNLASFTDFRLLPLSDPATYPYPKNSFHATTTSLGSNRDTYDSVSTSYDGPSPNYAHSDHTTRHRQGFRAVFRFLYCSPAMLAAVTPGICGALACFAFTYWLASQIFYCPQWTINCQVGSSARFFAERLGLVQGIVSTIFSVSIAGIVFGTYQFAEATIWPLLAAHSMSIQSTDRFLAHTRGSLASFPAAVWHTWRKRHIVPVLIVGILGLMLHLNSTIVGLAYTIMPVPTALQSQQKQGGGMGFPFVNQVNPPGIVNGEIQLASVMYSSWANQQSIEALPELRDYIISRANLSQVGNFTVNAVHLEKTVNCYAHPIDAIVPGLSPFLLVNTTMNIDQCGEGGFVQFPGKCPVLFRVSANGFSSWVENYWNLSSTRAVTKLIFASLNSTFEGGYNNQVPRWNETFDICAAEFQNQELSCSVFSSLACDVDIDLTPGQACVGPCSTDPSAIADLTSLAADYTTGIASKSYPIWQISNTLAAAATQFGPYTWGAQPFYQLETPLPNSTYALPLGYSDTPGTIAKELKFSQANITNFIHVAIGAVAEAMTRFNESASTTIVRSSIELPRLDRSRSYVLLAPLGLAVLSLLILAGVNAMLYNSAANLDELRLGSTSNILLSVRNGNIMSAVRDIDRRSGDGSTDVESSVDRLRWRLASGDGRGRSRGLDLNGGVHIVPLSK